MQTLELFPPGRALPCVQARTRPLLLRVTPRAGAGQAALPALPAADQVPRGRQGPRRALGRVGWGGVRRRPTRAVRRGRPRKHQLPPLPAELPAAQAEAC